MKKNITFIGGDLITIYLIKMFIKEGYNVATFALEQIEDNEYFTGDEIKKISFEENIRSATLKSDNIIIANSSLSTDLDKIIKVFSNEKIEKGEILKCLKGKKVVTGNLSSETKEELIKNENQIINIVEMPEFKILRSRLVSEGILKFILENSERTIYNNDILVLGYGNIGKRISYLLKMIGANVTVAARRTEALEAAKNFNLNVIKIDNISSIIQNNNIIINTIPTKILEEKSLKQIKKGTYIIDIANSKNNIDKKIIREKNIKSNWLLSVAETMFPESFAENIFDILKELMI